MRLNKHNKIKFKVIKTHPDFAQKACEITPLERDFKKTPPAEEFFQESPPVRAQGWVRMSYLAFIEVIKIQPHNAFIIVPKPF